MKTIYVYTDGSASNNKTKIGGWAYMILGLHKESGSELNTTSNRMELTAVIKALKFFITEAINEGLDIENERKGERGGEAVSPNGDTIRPTGVWRKSITSKKVGRILTEIGLNQATKAVASVITDSIQTEKTSKNE